MPWVALRVTVRLALSGSATLRVLPVAVENSLAVSWVADWLPGTVLVGGWVAAAVLRSKSALVSLVAPLAAEFLMTRLAPLLNQRVVLLPLMLV